MRKIIAVVVVAGGLLFAGLGGMPVQAEGNGPSICNDLVPGEIVSSVAVAGFVNAGSNPGNPKNLAPPFVPFVVGCNPAD